MLIPELPNKKGQTVSGTQLLNDNILFAECSCTSAKLQTLICWCTFKMCPEIFFQLLIVHAKFNERTLPCVYALLPNKRKETHDALYGELTRVVPDRSDDISMDFESTYINAATANLQNLDITGCLSHL